MSQNQRWSFNSRVIKAGVVTPSKIAAYPVSMTQGLDRIAIAILLAAVDPHIRTPLAAPCGSVAAAWPRAGLPGRPLGRG
jgi:hypothetical protein